MGGKAIKKFGFEENRLNVSEYEKLSNSIKEIINNSFKGLNFKEVLYYKNKDSFGDMDIIYNTDEVSYNEISYFIKKVIHSPYYYNGGVFSFAYNNFQIDFIGVCGEDYECAYNYFSFNDLGNFLGKIANRKGFSYGYSGLKYKVKEELFNNNGSNILREVCVSKNVKEIYDFLGYDYSRYEKGFDDIKDIFEYVVSGKYFNKEIFNFDKFNYEYKRKYNRRDNQKLFIEYLKSVNKEDYVYKDKYYYLSEWDKYNNNLKYIIEEEREKYFNKKKVQSKFNGDLVKKLLRLEGKELGNFIVLYKNSKKDFDLYIKETDQVDIIFDIYKFYYDYKE